MQAQPISTAAMLENASVSDDEILDSQELFIIKITPR
jgi:hypothetical protein